MDKETELQQPTPAQTLSKQDSLAQDVESLTKQESASNKQGTPDEPLSSFQVQEGELALNNTQAPQAPYAGAQVAHIQPTINQALWPYPYTPRNLVLGQKHLPPPQVVFGPQAVPPGPQAIPPGSQAMPWPSMQIPVGYGYPPYPWGAQGQAMPQPQGVMPQTQGAMPQPQGAMGQQPQAFTTEPIPPYGAQPPFAPAANFNTLNPSQSVENQTSPFMPTACQAWSQIEPPTPNFNQNLPAGVTQTAPYVSSEQVHSSVDNSVLPQTPIQPALNQQTLHAPSQQRNLMQNQNFATPANLSQTQNLATPDKLSQNHNLNTNPEPTPLYTANLAQPQTTIANSTQGQNANLGASIGQSQTVNMGTSTGPSQTANLGASTGPSQTVNLGASTGPSQTVNMGTSTGPSQTINMGTSTGPNQTTNLDQSQKSGIHTNNTAQAANNLHVRSGTTVNQTMPNYQAQHNTMPYVAYSPYAVSQTEKWYNSLGVHILMIALISILLMIPNLFFSYVLDDRMDNQRYAVSSMTSAWGDEQVLADPELKLKVRVYNAVEANTYVDAKGTFIYHYYAVRPQEAHTNVELKSEKRYKGNYEATLYTLQVAQTAHFDLSKAKKLMQLDSTEREIAGSDVQLVFKISDSKGIDKIKRVLLNGIGYEVFPSEHSTGFEVKIPLNVFARSTDLDVQVEYMVRGSQELSFVPLAQVSEFEIDAVGSQPNFTGSFLPREREVDLENRTFSAHYYQNNLSTGQSMVSTNTTHDRNLITIELADDADSYVLIERLTKYVLMFIAMTFVSVLAFEIVSRKLVSLVQYVVIGVALILFYMVLLSLSEHFSFTLSYIIGSLLLSSMIAMYIKAMFASKKHGFCLFFMLLAMYAVLFAIVHIESYALLVGTALLVMMLGVVMYITRNLNRKDSPNIFSQGIEPNTPSVADDFNKKSMSHEVNELNTASNPSVMASPAKSSLNQSVNMAKANASSTQNPESSSQVLGSEHFATVADTIHGQTASNYSQNSQTPAQSSTAPFASNNAPSLSSNTPSANSNTASVNNSTYLANDGVENSEELIEELQEELLAQNASANLASTQHNATAPSNATQEPSVSQTPLSLEQAQAELAADLSEDEMLAKPVAKSHKE